MQMKLLVCLAAGVAAFGQAPTAPVVSPRGVINAFTLQPAPTSVAAGGIIHINGLNLGPAAGWKADSLPLPTSVGDPAIEVRIGNRALPLYSMTPGRIVAQIPVDIAPGLNQLTVRRGEAVSRPARFMVTQPSPSIATTNDGGFGAAGVIDGNTVKLRAIGLGQTDPVIAPGAAPDAEMTATPRAQLRANVGGISAAVTAKLAADKPGEFEVTIELPATAQEGEVVNLYAGNANGNRVTYKSQAEPKVDFIRLPEDATNLRAMVASDLRPGFAVLSGPRGDDGCWPSYLVDADKKTAAKLDGCFTAAAAQLPTPFTQTNEGTALAALVGPPDGDAQTGISSKVAILNPASEAMQVELSGKALTLNPAPNGALNAILGGQTLRVAQINTTTGEVTEGGAPGGGGGVPGGGGGGINFANLQVDFGDGVKEVVTVPTNIQQGQQAVVAVDSLEKVTAAKFGLINAQLAPISSVAFPEDWLPLLAPLPAPAPGGGGGGVIGIPGVPGGGGPANNRFRVPFFWDAALRQYYVIARAKDNSRDAFVRFPVAAGQQPQVIAFPEGVFASSCVQQVRVFSLELSRSIAVATSATAETTVKNPCGAKAFRTLDLTTRALADAALPGTGEISIVGNAVNEVNDYIYGSNTDPGRQNRADTIYVFDGVTASSFRLDLPPEVATFANVTPFAPMGILYAQATARVVGDAGIVVFDLENAAAKLLPTPAGFASVQPLTIFPATRKLIARGTRTEPAGTQILIYDLVSGDLKIVANPQGVTWMGAVPNVPGQPGQPPNPATQQPALQNANPKGNSVTMVGFDAQRRPVGVVVVRAH
jgi:uncharacterized protein (TIGR03437 family)